MTVFTIIRSLCGMRVNDVSKHDYSTAPGKRNRYTWVCAKLRCKPCAESVCPMIKNIAALKNVERRKTLARVRAVQHGQHKITPCPKAVYCESENRECKSCVGFSRYYPA